MSITKNKGMSLLAIFITIVIYNVIVFVIPFNRGGGFWTGYVFSMLALILTAGVGFYAFGKVGIKSKFYGVPLVSVAWRYLIAQLVVGLAEMTLTFIPYRYGIALNVILLGACLLGLLGVDAAKEEVERIDEKVKEKVFYIRSLQDDVEILADKASDEAMKKVLKDLAEVIRYSDPMSNPQLAAIENKIEVKAAILAEHIVKVDYEAAKALCSELQQLFAERNRKCKTLK